MIDLYAFGLEMGPLLTLRQQIWTLFHLGYDMIRVKQATFKNIIP